MWTETRSQGKCQGCRGRGREGLPPVPSYSEEFRAPHVAPVSPQPSHARYRQKLPAQSLAQRLCRASATHRLGQALQQQPCRDQKRFPKLLVKLLQPFPAAKGVGSTSGPREGSSSQTPPWEMGFEQLDAEFWGSGDVGKEQGSLTSKSGLFHSSIPRSRSTETIPVPVRGAGENPAADVGI